MKITIQRYTDAGKLEPVTINGYKRGALAVHKTASGHFWIVSHEPSGHSVTGGRQFDSKAQAVRFADELQRRLDFSKLTADSDMTWDVQKAFGSEAIRIALGAAFQEAFGS